MTSTLIASRLIAILKSQPNLKIKSTINIAEQIFNYTIKYGKAWRAKQRAWKMIYGSWEEAYEKLPSLLAAMKAANPGMHYEYIPKPNAWQEDGMQIFFRAFCASLSLLSHSVIVGLCSLLMALSCCASTWAHSW